MATLSITLVQKTNITARISGLSNPSNSYQFQFEAYRVGYPSEYYADRFTGTSGNTYQDHNFPKLLPGNQYRIVGWAQYPIGGTWYYIGELYQTTNNITEPASSEYLPTYYPSIRHQGVLYNGVWYGQASDCVAVALSTAMDIFEYRERGTSDNYYSIGWIYGNRAAGDYHGVGMFTNQALAKLSSDGTPNWNRIDTKDIYPDNYHWGNVRDDNGAACPSEGAEDMVASNYNTLKYEAYNQKLNYTPTAISFYDCASIAAAVQANGCVTVDLFIGSAFDNTPSTGIIPDPVSTSQRGGHTLLIIGWKTIGATKYWILQNGWDTDWGDGGRGYLKMNYGTNRAAPSSQISYNWFYDCYSIQNVIASNPVVPTGLALFERVEGGLSFTWNYSYYSDSYTLRYKGDDGVYHTFPNLLSPLYLLAPLGYGAGYYVSVRGDNYRASSSYTAEQYVITSPITPILAKNSNDTTSITISVSGMSGNYTDFLVEYKLTTDAFYTQINNCFMPYTITGLTPERNYHVRVKSRYLNSGTSYYSVSYSNRLTVYTANRPAPFDWDYERTAGMDYSTNKIKATEWERLQNNVNDIRAYKGLDVYSFSTPITGNTFTYTYWNEIISAISDLSAYYVSLPPETKSQGDKLIGSEFTALKDCINSVP